jgi:ABC-type multidrug transport system fused ATPase/permease subunit
MYDLRARSSHLQRLPLPYYDRNPVGRTMTRVTSDVEVLNELFSSGVVTIFGDVFTLLLIVTAMFVMDWQLALVTMAVMPFVFGVAIVFRTRIREAYRDVRVRLARINAYLQEHISGVAVVQLFGREQAAADRFREINDHYLAAHLRSITYYALFFPVIEVLTAIALAVIIIYGGFALMAGTVSVGTMAAFLQFARRFFRPIQDLSEKYNMLQGAMASSERIFALLDTPESERPTAAAPRAAGSPGRGEIEFRNVWFAYVREATRRRRLGLGPARRQLPYPAGRARRHRRPYRRRQDVAHQPAAALLRAAARRDPASTAYRSATCRSTSCGTASASCCRTSSCSAAHRIQHPLGRTDIDDERVRGSGPARRRGPVHRAPAPRLRRAARRARGVAVRRRAAAALLRPRPRLRPAGPDPGRGDQLRRLRARGAHRPRARHADARPHVRRHRAPPVHRPERRPHHRAAPRRAARAGHAR